MLEILGLILLTSGFVQGGQVCYERIGCFPDEAPWGGTVQRPIARLPDSPEHINTRFLLFTKENPDTFQEIRALTPGAISTSNFKASRKTRFIIHGFIEHGYDRWLTHMCATLLKVEDVNCFCVDWTGGAYALYSQAANNVRVVGAEVAHFIQFLSNQYGYSAANVHVIGHSLGSHAAGEAGKRTPGIARITGLDPAGPFFQNTPPEVRLDQSDAQLVDVIHTDASAIFPLTGFGIGQSVGHLDFYPNGGKNMPGCKKSPTLKYLDNYRIFKGSKEIIFCSHIRSYKFYTESILTPDAFVAFPSSDYKTFKKGTGFPCPSGGCPLMGHYAEEFLGPTSGNLSFFLNTGNSEPFARWRYRVTVRTTGTGFLGSIQVSLHGIRGNSKQQEIASGFIKPGGTYSAFIDTESDVGPLTTASFTWKKSLIDLIPGTVGADTVTVQYGKDGQTYHFCSTETVKPKTIQNLTPCYIPDE
ncbi:hypothetical protein XENTR_v10017574 [Xenopus tropicalis]|uniref:Triacylglycerol lipase n=1 Tax=Xenopus tropicalis TaxID=8364 RepID=F7AFG4_XENTR|nr:pancreatic lipase-related protein 2 isoform X1 [Xenopus tropicalis]XP_012810165.2 pancreatic lipase-related protein 2 isoform X1 [Xenopus tropicalis]KAE8589469.1 hypothetical protein XENTR_v10017574 [Xenopus tropicalis]